MKILQIAPPTFKIPPDGYGGTERIIYYLVQELSKAGHEVVLLAPDGSRANVEVIHYTPPLYGKQDEKSLFNAYVSLFNAAISLSKECDVAHFHLSNFYHLAIQDKISTPFISTVHDNPSLAQLNWINENFKNAKFTAISKSQIDKFPSLNWFGLVHHGLPKDLYEFSSTHENYLLYLGKIAEDKGFDDLLQIAYMTKKKLIIGAKKDRKPFSQRVREFINKMPNVEIHDEVGGSFKEKLLSKAEALLFPIKWDEPFGLAAIEALASGTPVITRARGSLPEIIKENENGYFFETLHQAVNKINRLSEIDRKKCRQSFEDHFTSEKMAEGYLAIYKKLLDSLA